MFSFGLNPESEVVYSKNSKFVVLKFFVLKKSEPGRMANFCSLCGGTASSVNYAKKVDPPIQPYSTILGDMPPQKNYRRPPGGQMPHIQMCIPTPVENSPPNSGGPCPNTSIIQIPCDTVKPCPRFICEPCPPPPPTKIWLIKSSPTPQKSACLPVGNSGNHCPIYPPPAAKLLVCLPCPPPACVSSITHDSNEVCSIPFGVPQLTENGKQKAHPSGGKYLPPPQRRICGPNCIHVSDIRGEKPCSWHEQIPCVAHCFNTPLRKN